jgi:hypothetical protein
VTIIDYLEPGPELRITEAPIAGDDGVTWYQVLETDRGTFGFVVGHLLEPRNPSLIGPTPSPK